MFRRDLKSSQIEDYYLSSLGLPGRDVYTMTYPLVITGDTSSNGGFLIAMLVYPSVMPPIASSLCLKRVSIHTLQRKLATVIRCSGNLLANKYKVQPREKANG